MQETLQRDRWDVSIMAGSELGGDGDFRGRVCNDFGLAFRNITPPLTTSVFCYKHLPASVVDSPLRFSRQTENLPSFGPW